MVEPPDALTNQEQHDLEEIAHEIAFELENITVYTIQSECTNEGCDLKQTATEVVGTRPRTTAVFKDTLYELYESFYENPRSIAYRTLATLAPDDEEFGFQIAITDLIADAVDLGVRDADEEREKRSKTEVLDHIIN